MSETLLEALETPEEIDPPENPPAPETDTQQNPPAGWVKDKQTGQYRPRKRPGRKTPTPPPADHEPIARGEDTPPDNRARGKTAKGTPRYQKGVIAAGMTKLYRRAGRIIKAMDRDIGVAIAECAEDCGEAWEDLARTNPRIRAALMRLIAGGAWTQLILAHAPILLAVIMKDHIAKHIPFLKLMKAMLESDEQGESDLASALGGLTPADAEQMVATMMNGPLASMVAGMMAAQNGDQG